MKNIERIQKMNSDELAELLLSHCTNFCNGNKCGFGCYVEVKQWLEQESEE